MTPTARYIREGCEANCPKDQMVNFAALGIELQPKQLLASAAARLCDQDDGPFAIGYGGARGGGKSFWMLAQMGLDDCQRFPGLKCLLLRKVGKSNLEHLEDLRHKLFRQVPHEYAIRKGIITFRNGSRIICGHFQKETDIDAYLGLEYDVIGVEEATTLTARKYSDIATCCRSSKVGADGKHWRPRMYSTTNPGGVGHTWYKNKFILPFQTGAEKDTRFIPAKVEDNRYNNPGYIQQLEELPGWKKRAWREGDWDIAAGQFFTTFRRNIHVLSDFDESRALEWFAAFDYGYSHYTVVLLGCVDGDGNIYIVDEHAKRGWLPERHARAINEMFARHNVQLEKPQHHTGSNLHHRIGPRIVFKMPDGSLRPAGTYYEGRMPGRFLKRFVAGTDVFSRQSDGTTIAQQYAKLGIRFTQANTDRVNGWADILTRLGDPDEGIPPRLFIHKRCEKLAECLPALQHDPNRPEDIKKCDVEEDGVGGDDTADALRYLVATKPRELHVRKLTGL